MKRNIPIIIFIITLVFILTFYRVTIPKEESKSLSGIPLNDYLYTYNLKTNTSTTILENNIYYLTQNKDNYTLNKQNIYTKTPEKITTFNSEACTINTTNIICTNKNNTTLYNLITNKKYQTNQEEPIIPYKDTYLTLSNNTLYLNQQTKQTTFRNLSSNLNYINYYQTNDNTYILLNNEENYYLYNLNKDTYTIIDYTNYNTYENGFYFFNKDTYKIYDLINNTTIIHNNPTKKDTNYITSLNELNTHLYLYDTITNNIYIINLVNNTIKTFTHDIFLHNISNIQVSTNYLYIEIENNQDKYILDLSKLDLKEISLENYLKEEEKEISTLINNIKKDYNVNLNIKDDTNIEYPDFKAEIQTDNRLIKNAIQDINLILSKFNSDFFNNFYNNNYNGLNIYLTSTLTPNDYTTQISKPAAYSLLNNNEYMIVIDINQTNIKKLTCHELFHNIEFNLKTKNITPYQYWPTFNPLDFTYNNSYTKEYKYNYILTEEDPNNVYFIDYYSQSYPEEDRARIFENICAYDSSSIVKEYTNLHTKARYIKEELLTYYPTLKNTTLFSSLN